MPSSTDLTAFGVDGFGDVFDVATSIMCCKWNICGRDEVLLLNDLMLVTARHQLEERAFLHYVVIQHDVVEEVMMGKDE
ncbi:MAG: hypothetical protein AcusKO_02870 [Acuticoccus sp.]